jgi:hypothetical protein
MPNQKPPAKLPKVTARANSRSIPPLKQIDPRQIDWINKLLTKTKDN